MNLRRSTQSSRSRNLIGGSRGFVSARRALFATGLTAAAVWACSSSVDLQPLEEQTGMDELNPPSGSAGSGSTVVLPNPNTEVPPTPMLEPSGAGGSAGAGNGNVAPNGSGTGGGAGSGGASSGGAGPTGSAGMGAGGAPVGAAGAPPCADTDGDGRCNDVDNCPDVPDQGSDGDGDGTPDACDPCPNLQDDGTDSDGDGRGDACDTCGIGVALALDPLYYFTLDEGPTATTAVNRGTVPNTASYIGPVERGLAGISDPNGKAIRLSGGANGEFSRVTMANVNVFPTTALTATFWLRTTRIDDYGIISFAIQNSNNEFAILVDQQRLRVSLESANFIAENLDPNTQLADGAWHFVALTWQQTVAQFYIDGEAAGDVIRTEPGFEVEERANVPLAGLPSLGSVFGGGVFVLGQDQDTLNGGFNVAQALVGGLDEVGLWDRSLTPEEIRQIYTGTTCGEVCDGEDNDDDGLTDEGFLGTAAACAAASCGALSDAQSAFGTGEYVSTNPDAPLICNF